MTDFKGIMSKRTDSELLEITTLLNDSYQPEAVVAAEAELKVRNLNDQQLADAQLLLDKKKEEQAKKNEKFKIIENKAAELADAFNPLTEKSTDKRIKMITVFLAISFLVFLIKNSGMISFMLQDIGNADIFSLEYFAPIILFPIGLYGFWTTKKFGWVIMTILITYLTITTIVIMGFEIKWAMQEPINFDNNGLIQVQEVNNPALEELFGKKGFAFYIGQLVLFAGLLFFLNKDIITEKYLVSKRVQLLTICLTATPFLLLGLRIFV